MSNKAGFRPKVGQICRDDPEQSEAGRQFLIVGEDGDQVRCSLEHAAISPYAPYPDHEFTEPVADFVGGAYQLVSDV